MNGEGQEGLPPGWATTTLGEICSRIVDGSHNPPKAKQTGLPMLSARNIQNRRIIFDDFRFISEEDFAGENLRTQVNAGDVLLTIVGAIGRTAVVPEGVEPFTLQRSVAVLKPQHTTPRLLSYFLEAPALQQHFQDNAKGTAQKGIYLKALAETPCPLPPPAEQIRIADKLAALLSRVDSGRERLERVPKLLTAFRRSVLNDALSGEYETKKLQMLLIAAKTGPFGSALHQSDYITGGIPVINPMHINDGEIVPTEGMTVPFHKAEELGDFRVRSGGVIIGRRGVMGRCAVIGDKHAGWLCGTGSMILYPTKQLDPRYLALFLRSPRTVEALEADSVGSTMINLNQKILLALEIPLPTRQEQVEIVRRVEALFAIADRLETRYRAALTSFDRLTPALLAKAFRGELVPQDPNDEPASVLLERIQAQRASAPGKVKRGRSAKTPPEAVGEQPAKRRGRPRKTPADDTGAAPGIPEAGSYEEAVQLLEGRRLVSTD